MCNVHCVYKNSKNIIKYTVLFTNNNHFVVLLFLNCFDCAKKFLIWKKLNEKKTRLWPKSRYLFSSDTYLRKQGPRLSLFGWRQGGDVRQFAATPSPPRATVDSPPTPKTADSRLYYLRRLYCPLVFPLVIWRFVPSTLLLPVVKSDAVPNLTSAFCLGRHCSRLRVSIFMTRYKNEKESDFGGTLTVVSFRYKLSYVKRCCVFSL